LHDDYERDLLRVDRFDGKFLGDSVIFESEVGRSQVGDKVAGTGANQSRNDDNVGMGGKRESG
jgi:hypothetical protein